MNQKYMNKKVGAQALADMANFGYKNMELKHYLKKVIFLKVIWSNISMQPSNAEILP